MVLLITTMTMIATLNLEKVNLIHLFQGPLAVRITINSSRHYLKENQI